MIDVELIKINVRMPSDQVRIVAMQPFIKLHSTTEEPFRWSNDATEVQLDAIRRTLDIARGGFGGPPANFTLFPEYAIPGIDGVIVINNRISEDQWPNESIIIAGVHGIFKNEYRDLCDVLTANISPSNAPDSIPDDKWVNCCVIWVKDREGLVQKWVQLKVRPAWPEMTVPCNDMFCGTNVYVFEGEYEPSGYPCRFVTLICFDWVVSVAGTTVCHELLSKLTKLRAPNPTPLDWVFVVQHNLRPNHQSFLNCTNQFLTDNNTFPFIERDKAIVVHSNTAVSPKPTRTGLGGFSACVFSPSAQFDCNSCRPTVCMQPKLLRKENILERCKDVVFREMGECIHVFTVRVPRFVTPNVTDRTYPLPLAHVHAVNDSNDPRLSGGSIPAAVKWVNDSLDTIERVSANELKACSLKARAEAIESTIIEAMRLFDGHTASNSVNWAACSFSHRNESRNEVRRLNSDIWEEVEADAFKHVLHSLTSLGLAYSLEFESALLHGTIYDDEGFVQVVAIRGDTHEDCRLQYDNFIPKLGADPVLVIACDRYNLTPTSEEYSRIYETHGERALSFLDYQTLITYCRNAVDSNTLKEQIDDNIQRRTRII